mgnify:CR=1 FL=1
MILAVLDTSTRFAGVGVVDEAGKRVTRAWRSNQNHGAELMPALVDSLDELDLSPTDLTHVAVALGPGGFSAVRVGISTALGLVVANQLPVLGIPTHIIEVHPHRKSISADRPVYSLLPAGRNEISWQRHDGRADSETGVAAPEELADHLGSEALVCGEASELMVELLVTSRILDTGSPTRPPDSMIDIASAKFRAGVEMSSELIRPIYARAPSISRPKSAK